MVTTYQKTDDNEEVTKVIPICRQSFFDYRQIDLIMPSNLREIFDFKKAKLVKSSRNNEPFYYVEFSAFDAIKGKLRRKRIYTINTIGNLEQRESARLEMPQDNFKNYSLESALECASEVKKRELAQKSYANYKNSKNYIPKFSDFQSLRHQNGRLPKDNFRL